jgi:hypothetical protein
MPKVKTIDLDELVTKEQIEIDDLKIKLKNALENKTDYLFPDEVIIFEQLVQNPYEPD